MGLGEQEDHLYKRPRFGIGPINKYETHAPAHCLY